MAIAAAIVGGLGAVGSIGGALIGSNAAQNASAQQVAMQKLALAQQQQMFGTAQNALNPYINAGQSALPTLQGLITPGANQNALLAQTPGFKFASQYGTMAATNALAAKTGPSAGPLAAGISQYNSGLAQNTWLNTVNALQGYAGLGGNAGGALAGDAISSGNAQAGTLTNTGNAMASGTLGSANALAGGLTGAAGSASNALLLQQILGGNNSGIYGAANKGLSNSVSNGGYNYLDAQAG